MWHVVVVMLVGRRNGSKVIAGARSRHGAGDEVAPTPRRAALPAEER
jgi:hypothetical protein